MFASSKITPVPTSWPKNTCAIGIVRPPSLILISVLIPCDRHQRAEPRRVIVVMVGDENRADLPRVDAGLRETTRDAIAGIDDIRHSVDHQQIGRLRAMGSRRRAGRRPERDEAGLSGRHFVDRMCNSAGIGARRAIHCGILMPESVMTVPQWAS